jgi:hypothetical protein
VQDVRGLEDGDASSAFDAVKSLLLRADSEQREKILAQLAKN